MILNSIKLDEINCSNTSEQLKADFEALKKSENEPMIRVKARFLIDFKNQIDKQGENKSRDDDLELEKIQNNYLHKLAKLCNIFFFCLFASLSSL